MSQRARRMMRLFREVRVPRTGRPMLDLVILANELGANNVEVAAVLDCTLEHLQSVADGQERLTQRQVDWLSAMLTALHWHHCYRLGFPEARDADALNAVVVEAGDIWRRLPSQLVTDWQAAHRETVRGEA